MSISLIAVFIPILMMGGIVGRLFREFAVVLSVAIVDFDGDFAHDHAHDVRAAAARKHEQRHGYLYNSSETFSDWVSPLLRAVARLGAATPAADAGGHARHHGVNVYLYVKIPKGFFPQQDTGRLNVTVLGEQHISYQALVERRQVVEQPGRSDPDVSRSMVAGAAAAEAERAQHGRRLIVQLKPMGAQGDVRTR